MKKKGFSVGIWLVFILVMGMHFILSALTPLYADDFAYSYSFAAGTNSKMTDFASLIQSQIGHYQSMNGRVVAHTLAQFFLMMPKTVFDLTNSFMFALLGFLICFHAFGKCRSIRVLDLLLTYAALLLFAPSFGQSYLWLIGSCNYLFTFVIVLLFLIPYRICWHKTTKSNFLVSAVSAFVMLAFGVIAGNTNENTGVSLAIMLLIYIVAYILYNRKVKIWMITGWCGAVTGFAVCMMAPGNIVRTGGSPLAFSIASVVKYTIFYTYSAIESFAPIFVVLAILLGAVLLTKSRKGKLTKEVLFSSLKNNFCLYFYGVFFLGCVYAMAVPAQFPDRAWSHPLALLLIVFLGVFRKVIPLLGVKPNDRRLMRGIGCIVLVTVMSLGYCTAVTKLRAVSYAHNRRISMIQEAKANNQNEVEIPAILSKSRFVCYDYLGDLSEDPHFWTNKAMAQYYGIDFIYKSDDVVI